MVTVVVAGVAEAVALAALKILDISLYIYAITTASKHLSNLF